jgi:hypothetical protein
MKKGKLSGAGVPSSSQQESNGKGAGHGSTASHSAGKSEADLPLMDFPMEADTLDRACQQAGFTALNANAVMASAVVGDALKKVGAVKIGRARLMLADENIDTAIGRVEHLLSSPDVKPELKVEIMKVVGHLIGRKIVVAKAMISSAQIDMSDGAKVTSVIPSFLPRAKVVPFDQAPVTVDVPPLDKTANGAGKT